MSFDEYSLLLKFYFAFNIFGMPKEEFKIQKFWKYRARDIISYDKAHNDLVFFNFTEPVILYQGTSKRIALNTVTGEILDWSD